MIGGVALRFACISFIHRLCFGLGLHRNPTSRCLPHPLHCWPQSQSHSLELVRHPQCLHSIPRQALAERKHIALTSWRFPHPDLGHVRINTSGLLNVSTASVRGVSTSCDSLRTPGHFIYNCVFKRTHFNFAVPVRSNSALACGRILCTKLAMCKATLQRISIDVFTQALMDGTCESMPNCLRACFRA